MRFASSRILAAGAAPFLGQAAAVCPDDTPSSHKALCCQPPSWKHRRVPIRDSLSPQPAVNTAADPPSPRATPTWSTQTASPNNPSSLSDPGCTESPNGGCIPETSGSGSEYLGARTGDTGQKWCGRCRVSN